MRPDVIVIGAGIAGLAAAYELCRRGIPFLLLEAGPRAGGVVLSERWEAFTIDAGPDSLLVQKPEGVKLCEELGLGERLVPTKPPRVAYILRGGRLHPLPAASVLGIPTEIAPFLRSTLFTWTGKLRMGAEIFVPRRSNEEDESIGAFVARRFGREAATFLAEPLLAGIHAGDVDRLSVRALFPRFVEAERTHGSLLRAFRARRAATSDGGAALRGPFVSLPGGLSELVDALVATLPAHALRLNAPVRQVGHGFTVDAGGPLQAPAVIMATPAYVTARLVRQMDSDLGSRCDEIHYASTATIAIAFRRGVVAHPLAGSGFVAPRVERTGILAASWLSSKWPHRAPEGFVLMRTFAGGARDPDALEHSDEALVARSLGALRPLLGISGEPTFARVYRWTSASAQHEVGHLARIAAIDRRLEQQPGLFLTGSGFRGVGIPDCVADGRATAARAAAWLAERGTLTSPEP